ncbi:MAG: hypothetical protein ISS57_19715 [Anaerolineales bacterium]|nr:hypothetical protein [Chloroflexota bacterium]MBL7164822.1 hypothetical protein [Anaerolineales bacterium]
MQYSNVQHSTQKTLGPATAIYRDRPLRWRDFFLIFLPGGVAALAPFFYGLQRDLYARAYYGPVAAGAWSWPWYALATVALIPLILLALHRVRQAHRIVMLHKHGLMIHWTGGQHHRLPWEEIDGLICNTIENTFLEFPLKTRHRLTICTQSGKLIRIDDRIPKLPELTARLKAKIYPRLLPQLRAAFQKGDTLDFGPIILHKKWVCFKRVEKFRKLGRAGAQSAPPHAPISGLSSTEMKRTNKKFVQLREQEIPWEQVARLNVVSGQLVVESHSNQKIKIAVGKIPNVDLLIQLLQEGVHP